VSVFQAVTLCDVLEFETAGDVTLVSDPPLPFDSATNLALRAALLLRATARVQAGARIRLRKRIPVAAGLGGGSADGAATLLALQTLWGLTTFDLNPIAVQLGSDVPYFFGSATALVRGRGERLTSLPPLSPRAVLLVRPPVALATAHVFAQLRPPEWTDGSATLSLAASLAAGEGMVEEHLRNGLLAAAERCCLPLRTLREALQAEGWTPHLSGSGPTIFLFPESPAEAARIRTCAEALGAECWGCRTLRQPPLKVRRPGLE
jgi:4-diphosphocytidyl-2-C-methyl-D-erythritol kinase